MATASGKLKGKSLSARTSQILGEVKKPGPGHHVADQRAHIEQWLEGKKETGHGFPPAGGGGKKMPTKGKIPPQFLKNEGKGLKGGSTSNASSAADAKAAAKKKKAGRASAVAKRLGGAKKGSLPPWLEKK